MNKLHDYLDYDKIKVITNDGDSVYGKPICVNYSDDTGMAEDEIVIENDKIMSFFESDIQSIIVLDEIEDTEVNGTEHEI